MNCQFYLYDNIKMNNVLKIGKGKKKKDNLLTIFRAGKNVHDKNQKRHHPNRRRMKLGGKRPAVKRIANNHESTRGVQMR